ncbi:hypothetical protein LguiA_027301 [Lonicera macranthoides]
MEISQAQKNLPLVEAATTQLGQSNKQPPPNPTNIALFIFIDSLYDPGNNYINTTTEFFANLSPYVETFFNYPTGRFSDGRLIPDFIDSIKKNFNGKPYSSCFSRSNRGAGLTIAKCQIAGESLTVNIDN